MKRLERPPAGPRGAIGAAAERAAAAYLIGLGWTVIARNVFVSDLEIDIVAREPDPLGTFVIVEVRSRSGPSFGAAVESVDARKVARLYRAAGSLRRGGHPAVASRCAEEWRVDLLTLRRTARAVWIVDVHLRGLTPP